MVEFPRAFPRIVKKIKIWLKTSRTKWNQLTSLTIPARKKNIYSCLVKYLHVPFVQKTILEKKDNFWFNKKNCLAVVGVLVSVMS